MRRAILFALVGTALLYGCGGSGDSGGNKATLLQHVEEGFEERGAPPQFTDCLVRRLGATLDNREIEKAYESVSSDASESEVAQAVGPKATRAVAEASLVCGRQLLRSGDYSRAELRRIFNSSGSP